jgi:hypothetical protein
MKIQVLTNNDSKRHFPLQVIVTLELAASSGCGVVRDLAVLLVSSTVDSDFLLPCVVKVLRCCFLV